MNKKKSTLMALFLTVLFAWTTGTAQNATISVIKQGEIDFQLLVSDIDSIVFYDPGVKDPFDKQIPDAGYGTYSDGATVDMTNPFFWIRFAQNKGIDTDAIILTLSEIATLNRTSVDQGNLRLALPEDLGNETTFTYAQLDALATNYGYKSSPKNFATYMPSFSGSRNTQLGIITSFSQMLSYPGAPTNVTTYLETGLEVCEGVVIYHENNNHYLVKSQNYFGWVPKSTVAICTKSEFLEFVTPTNFIVVTAERLETDLGVPTMIRMGSKLPFVSRNGNYITFRVPTRTSSGGLDSQAVTLIADGINEYIHVGYLPYTTTNLLKQMFKMLGRKYGWGDEGSERDCSSTVWTVYKCCGFLLPRNTTQQQSINAGPYCEAFSGTHSQIVSNLSSYRPGTVVFRPGHVVMYLGYYNGAHYIMHQTGGTRSSCRVTGITFYSDLSIIRAFEK